MEDEILRPCQEAVEAHRSHEAVMKWFHQVRTFELPLPGMGLASFPMIEFRADRLGALVWSDGPGTWGTSGWHILTNEGAFPLDQSRLVPVSYGQTFPDILQLLVDLHSKASPPSRPWWRWW